MCPGTNTSLPATCQASTQQPATSPVAYPAEGGALDQACAVSEALVLDVRTASAYASGHIGCAVSSPRLEFASSTVAEVLALVNGDLGFPIQVYCYRGSWAREVQAALQRRGFTNVVNAGGFDSDRSELETLCETLRYPQVAWCDDTSAAPPGASSSTSPATPDPAETTATSGADGGGCPRNCGQADRGGGTCRTNGRCLSCNENRLRVNGICVQSLSCKGRRIQSGSMTGAGCRCLDDSCHFCTRVVDGDTCRVCRDGAYLLDGSCVASCPAGMASMGIGGFKRRCLAPFECQNGRIIGSDASYGCKCATDEMAPSSCQHCSFRADEFGTHCTRCLGGMYLRPDNRCHPNCDGLDGMVAYAPGTYGRECRPPFTCTDREDEAGNDCKCSRLVGRNDCASCDHGPDGVACSRCTNRMYLRQGTCVDACSDGETAVGSGVDGRECV